jgi:signal transduction histidine kinase
MVNWYLRLTTGQLGLIKVNGLAVGLIRIISLHCTSIEMKTAKRYSRISTLMILSQVMLLGLVVQWLTSQYRQEHIVVEKELSTIYNSAQERALDSLLFQFFISPALGDSAIRVAGYGRQPVQIRKVDTTRSMVLSGVRSKSASREVASGSVSIHITDSLIDHIEVKRNVENVVTGTDMALRGVRMIIRSDGDTTGQPGGLWRSMSKSIDTALFISSIEEGLKERGLRITFGFTSDQDSSTAGNTFRSGLVLGGRYAGSFPSIVFTGSGFEVLRTILPQILFGIMLLVFTGTAFILAHRSLRSQLIVSRIKDEFISNISHELKTPVATVKLALETLGRHELRDSSATVREYLRIATLETDRLDRLVSRVLDYGRMESSDTAFVMQTIDVSVMLEKAKETMAERVLSAGATVSIASENDLSVFGDTFYLESVITNLIDNSLKYGCGERCIIELLAMGRDGKVIISVSDNGPGIPPEYITRVFDKFFRVPANNLHNIKGYGLGLSFAQMVIINHHGTISVQNLPEGGCSFIITLPRYDQNPVRRG